MAALRIGLAVCSVFFVSAITHAQETNLAVSGLTSNPTYEKNCSKCHGKNAKGHFMGGPALQSEKVAGLSDDDVRKVITDGKGHMPKFEGKLTPEVIDTLVHEIRALNTK